MAGKALKRKMFAELDRLGAETDKTPAEYVYDFIASGKTMMDLANVLGCSRSYASRHLNADPEIAKALDAARRESAEALADETLQITDELARRLDEGEEIRPERIAALKEQNNIRKWLSAVNNPDRFAPKDKAIQINIGDLHLDAMRKVKKMVDITPEAPRTPEIDDE